MSKDWTRNSRSVYSMLGASNHTDEEREQHDYYATHPKATMALVHHVSLPPLIWEPAAGGGHIAEILMEWTGKNVICSDKYDYGYPLHFQADFLTMKKAPEGVEAIVTNPPYKYATEFVLQSLRLLPHGGDVYMLLRTQFLEGAKRYERIFKRFPPRTVYQFISRIDCAKNGDFKRYKMSAVSYAWFHWKRDVYGETKVTWIS